MITIKTFDQPITFTNTRDGSKTACDIEKVYQDIIEVFGHITKAAWGWTYNEPFDEPKPEKKSEVAPVQQKVEAPKVKNTDNIVKAEPEIMPEPVTDNAEEPFDNTEEPFDNTEPAKEVEAAVVEEAAEEDKPEEQLPGQMEIDEYEEALPKVEAEVVEKEPEEPYDEHMTIETMLGQLHCIRRILAEHATDLDDDITDDELIEIEAHIYDITANIKKIRRHRA